MAHKDWCGERCNMCAGCELEISMPCYPDCSGMQEDGFETSCVRCDSFVYYIEEALGKYDSILTYADVINGVEGLKKDIFTLNDLDKVVENGGNN